MFGGLTGFLSRIAWGRLAVRTVAWGGLAAVLMAVAAVVTLYVSTSKAPDRDALWKVERAPSYTVLDVNGNQLATRGSLYGRDYGTDELPDDLVSAFLSIEDKRFYDHSGVDFWGLTRALWSNLKAGRYVQGGSTITQQLAKNLFLTNERSLSRKLNELVYAIWLERHLTKNEILSLYLNRIYLGAGTYGVDAAAKLYFDKSAGDVTLAEAAILASLPKAPSRYAPTADLALAQHRASLVLGNMVEEGHITAEEAEAARANPAAPKARLGTDNLGFFADAVIAKANEVIGEPTSDVTIETTLDLGVQARAEDFVAAVMDLKGEDAKAGEAAVIVFSPEGALRAMVGGRSYAQSQFNRALQAKRQPGSAFKPFVYLTALEHGYRAYDAVYDEPIQIGDWSPENYTGKYLGELTVSEALAKSVNTVAVQLSQSVGPQAVIDTAHRLGITSEIAEHRSIALGTQELSLYDLTSAYLPFATNGFSAEPHMIVRIRANETVLYQYAAPRAKPIIAQDTAETMTYMLHRVVTEGTGQNAALGSHPAAGKTGTSQEYRDAWFVGYTAHYVTGVWVGNDNSDPMANVTGGGLPAEIWRRVMRDLHFNKQVAYLPGMGLSEEEMFAGRGNRGGAVERFVDRLRGRDGDPNRHRRSPGRKKTWAEMTEEERIELGKRREREKREQKRSWWPF